MTYLLEMHSSLHTCLSLSHFFDWNMSRKLSVVFTWKFLVLLALSVSSYGFSECLGEALMICLKSLLYCLCWRQMYFLFQHLRHEAKKKNRPYAVCTFRYLCVLIFPSHNALYDGSHCPELPTRYPLIFSLKWKGESHLLK